MDPFFFEKPNCCIKQKNSDNYSFSSIHRTIPADMLVGHPVHKTSREVHCALHQDVRLQSDGNLVLLINSHAIITNFKLPAPRGIAYRNNLQKYIVRSGMLT